MISLSDAMRALYGAYRLARGDAGGMDYFDRTVTGFWRSFIAAVIIAPLLLVLLGVRYKAGLVEAPVWRYLTVESIAYVMQWFAFPVLMLPVVKALDCEARYIGFIVAYNWASVWQNMIFLPILIILEALTISRGTASLIIVVVLAAVVTYSWYVTRVALAIGGFTAFGIVAIDYLLGYLILVVAQIVILGG